MREYVAKAIIEYVKEYGRRPEVFTEWGTPLVGFADANSPYIVSLREHAVASHCMPGDVLPGASIIVSYYVPFTRELAATNDAGSDDSVSAGGSCGAGGRLASEQWARAYEETNAMFGKLNEHIIGLLEDKGYRGAVSAEASVFSTDTLTSDWSHRHIACAAGLGTFGVNNMLITKAGCCGRYNSIITNLDVEPDAPLKEELCIYKRNGGCGLCVKNCPAGALSLRGSAEFDRQACYAVCSENAAVYNYLGSSYSGAGSEVCGKCVTASPCAFR